MNNFMPSRHRAARRHQAGMTLIEIMIALLMGAFLLGGILQIFISAKQSYRMQEELSRMQENGRFAMHFLTEDIRMADFWGCAGSSNIESKLNSNTTFVNFADAIAGQDNDNSGNDGDADNDENNNGIWDGTDSISLKGAYDFAIFVQDEPATTAAVLKVTNNSGLKANDIVIVSNCISGDMFQITNVTASGTAGFDNIVHNTNSGAQTSTPGNASQSLEVGPAPAPNPTTNRYSTDSVIYRANFTTYQIRNGEGNRPALFRSINGAAATELVEGIEDMQILYGADTDADNAPNYYVPAGSAGLNMNQVVSIRISLLVRSLSTALASEAVSYTYNGSTVTPTDRSLRRVFTSTIAVRNRLP